MKRSGYMVAGDIGLVEATIDEWDGLVPITSAKVMYQKIDDLLDELVGNVYRHPFSDEPLPISRACSGRCSIIGR